MSEHDTQAIINTAIEAATPKPIDEDGEGRFFSLVVPAGASAQTIDLEELRNQFRATPRRKKGGFTAQNAETFAEYILKHHGDSDGTEVWADVPSLTILGVLNAHGGAEAGWGDHRVRFTAQTTPAWRAWAKYDGKMLDQVEFAEHIEQRLIDVRNPTGATLLELAQTFHATSSAAFKSSQMLASGERKFAYEETVKATAGQNGEITIPRVFELAFEPFEGSTSKWKVIARLRFRIKDGHLTLGYVLERPEDILRDAWLEVVDDVQTRIAVADIPVWQGAPDR